MSKITIANVNKTDVTTPSGGTVTLFSDKSNSNNPSVKYSDGSVKDLTDLGGSVTGGTYVTSASTITLNNSDGTEVSVTGVTSAGTTLTGATWGVSASTLTLSSSDSSSIVVSGIASRVDENLYVDAINGSDTDSVIGSEFTAWKTISGAESAAVSGQTIIVLTDIVEANCGKDGLTYIFKNNSLMSYPSTDPVITGEDWNALWTDQSGTAISYTIIGGRFTIDSYWYGVWKRSIIRLTSASKVVMLDTEHIETIGDDGWNFYLDGNGSTIDIRASGDIVYAWQLVNISAPNTTCKLYSKGSIRTNDLGYGSKIVHTDTSGASDCDNAFMSLTAGKSITIGGHYVGGQRGGFTCSNSATAKSTFIITAPIFESYDPHRDKANDESGVVSAYHNCNHYVQFNVGVFKIHNDTTIPVGSRDGGHLSVTSVRMDAAYVPISFVLDMNVGLVLLGVGARLDYSRTQDSSAHKPTAIVNYNNATIVYTDPSAQTSFYDWKRGSNRYGGSVIDTKFCNFSFNGTTKVIVNPLAVTAGQVVFGTSDDTEDNAFIVGEFITNGTLKATTFVDNFTGINYATGIPKMKLLDSTKLTEYSKYEGLL